MASTITNGTESASVKPVQLSFPLPRSPQTRIHMHLTVLTTSILLFLTTTAADASSGGSPMGSFVYAMPNRTSPTAQPLSTALYTQSQTLDFATRLAKILARRTGKPTYVGNSISFAGAGLGGTVEEEMEGMGKVVEVVLAEVGKASAQEDGT
ncbi:hypothetical protein H2199_007105 [Coniosporium tulheliwenetii]|uniref:Uncharacterized protein n=1 Tax=Coniosporium tulheliwenetii TaxID=3383036 RepID=A0ACC2YST3_9PEZI|nr:hypothetical protein H2199_007105 [Cladosporium sp. JES 115]